MKEPVDPQTNYFYKVVVEYDGSGFHGWQHQPGQRTIQDELKAAIETILRSPISRFVASGRTDSGVHAKGQVVSFASSVKINEYQFCTGVSSILRGEVSALSLTEVGAEFHAQRSAREKTYEYRILNRVGGPTIEKGRVWHIPSNLSVTALKEQAGAFVGEHDFSSFRASRCCASHAVREITKIKISKQDDLVRILVTGNGFLMHMVRIMVGTLVEVVTEKLDLSIREIIAARDREVAGITAPPFGLFLLRVKYPE